MLPGAGCNLLDSRMTASPTGHRSIDCKLLNLESLDTARSKESLVKVTQNQLPQQQNPRMNQNNISNRQSNQVHKSVNVTGGRANADKSDGDVAVNSIV